MDALKKYSVGRTLLVLGLCLALTLGATLVLASPAPVPAGKSDQAVEQPQNMENPTQSSVTGKISQGDLRRSDKDFDWGYAISTLIIRFVGIFVVLGVIQVIMQISGRIFSTLDEKKKAQALK